MGPSGLLARLVPLLLALAASPVSSESIYAFFGGSVDASSYEIPLFKKYAVMNSGLLNASRYNDTIIASLGEIKARSLVTDLYMGTSNPNASYSDVVSGPADTASANGATFDFKQLDYLTQGLGKQLVYPYYALTYNPLPFQPNTSAANSTGFAQCLGFEDSPGDYTCAPYGATQYDDCWKCPPKNADGSGYSQYAQVMQEFATHHAELNVSAYLQVWNEPDLTTRFGYPSSTTTFFAGSSEDYVQMYSGANEGLRAGDQNTILGGPGSAFWISKYAGTPPQSTITSASDLVLLAVNESIPLDFVSFHDIAPCITSSSCGVENNGGLSTFDVRATYARYALTQPEALADGGRFNTTEIHCTEYFPATEANQYGLPYTASPALGIDMLNTFTALLAQTDVSQITWAQYMEPTQQNGTGLIDLNGNARPAWHTFRFWGDLPVERISTNTSSDLLQSVAGFNAYECHGSLLVWNNDTSEHALNITLTGMPFQNFSVQVYELNDLNMPGPGFQLPATQNLTNQSPASDGSYKVPFRTGLIPVYGVVYVNVTGNSCGATPNYPSGRVLKTHGYYEKRPAMTGKYGEFDQRTWTAHLGMGNETQGSAIAGATVLVDPGIQLNISMAFTNVPAAPNNPPIIMRVDYWDEASQSYPAENAFEFYQTNTSLAYSVPPLFGSMSGISHHVPVNLANFGFQANDSSYPVPSNWTGQMSILFMLQNGPANSAVRAYVQQNVNQNISVAAATNIAVAALVNTTTAG